VRGVIGGDAYLNTITLDDLDPVLFHSSRKDAPDNNLIVAFNFHIAPTQHSGHGSFQLYQIVSTQGTAIPLSRRFSNRCFIENKQEKLLQIILSFNWIYVNKRKGISCESSYLEWIFSDDSILFL